MDKYFLYTGVMAIVEYYILLSVVLIWEAAKDNSHDDSGKF